MKNVLIVIDMQNDFIDGALGTKEAVAIVPHVLARLQAHGGEVFFTRDTHAPDYLNTAEGKKLPVEHCIKGTVGWQIRDELLPFVKDENVIDKPTFGSVALMQELSDEHRRDPIADITLIGLCTDICVISNAMLLKAALPEIDIIIDAACCAGVTPESHATALDAMRACQIIIENV